MCKTVMKSPCVINVIYEGRVIMAGDLAWRACGDRVPVYHISLAKPVASQCYPRHSGSQGTRLGSQGTRLIYDIQSDHLASLHAAIAFGILFIPCGKSLK